MQRAEGTGAVVGVDVVKLEEPGSWDVAFGSQRIVFGAGTLARLGELVRELGGSRVLLVGDAGVRRAGHIDDAVRSLQSSSVDVHVFDEVDENPTTDHVEQGADGARRQHVDCIVGLGGGSAMDCAKGINFLLTNGGRMEDYRGHGKASRPMLPSLGVPTTAGTGSEAQSYALISQPRTHVKMACGDPQARFRTVVLDPLLPPSAPRDVIAATGMDAIAHAAESFVTRKRNPLSMLLAGEAWRLLEANLEAVLGRSRDSGVWGRMLLGAHLAGQAIELSMLGAAHACANPLTAHYGVVHGHAVSLMLPHVMRHNARAVGELYARLGSATGATAWERVAELRAAAGLPARLRDLGVARDRLARLAAEAEEQWTLAFNPATMTRTELVELYEAAY